LKSKPEFLAVVDHARQEESLVQDVIFSKPFIGLSEIFTAPVTEIVLVTAKSAESFEEMEKQLNRMFEGVEPPKGSIGVAIGAFAEVEYALLLIAGWDAIEVRLDFFCMLSAL
jgi:hypothetical protein